MTCAYENVYKKARLRRAWNHVRANGRSSKSERTRQAIEEFDTAAEDKLKLIAEQLRQRRFRFRNAEGVLVEKANGKLRPLVVCRIEERIVQRALLDMLLEREEVRALVDAPTSYGISKEASRREAITRLREETKASNGDRFYQRSDIQNFFTQIPRLTVLRELRDRVPMDDEFADLLERATRTILANSRRIKQYLSLFPTKDRGMPQGNALSSLFAGIALREFDRKMNDRGVVCLRYMDDFILISPSASKTAAAFSSAKQWLQSQGYGIYEGTDDKHAKGWAKDGVEFLGCEILPGLVRPTAKARRKLLESIDAALGETDTSQGIGGLRGMAHSLHRVSMVIRAWHGASRGIFNDAVTLGNIDDEILARLRKYTAQKMAIVKSGKDAQARRALGVFSLSELFAADSATNC